MDQGLYWNLRCKICIEKLLIQQGLLCLFDENSCKRVRCMKKGGGGEEKGRSNRICLHVSINNVKKLLGESLQGLLNGKGLIMITKIDPLNENGT